MAMLSAAARDAAMIATADVVLVFISHFLSVVFFGE
jgi:hypothetical protein